MNGAARAVVGSMLLTAVLTAGCKSSEKPGSEAAVQASSAKATGAKASAPEPKVNADGTIVSGDGVEREKPAAGKGNVQGRVLYNEKPAAGIEVKLCETFNRYLGGCSGETLTAKTDSNGEYLIKNVPPGIYEGLLVRVFDSSYFVFATSGIMQSAKYKIEADRTFFAADSALFKHDLKLISPKAGQKVAGDVDVQWKPYPDAAYYKFSIHPDSASGAKTEYDYINKRVDGESYELDKPLSPGSYRCSVTAYNANDVKLAESPDDIEFTVK